MTDKSIGSIQRMSDDAIIQYLGDFVRYHRLEQDITQKDLADKAGINRTTMSDLELGKRCQLVTLIQVLRILNKLYVFDLFTINHQISPIKLAEMEMNKRQKASSKTENTTKKKSDW
jgi:transcriptional regulator with XRE-family HTH domain